MQRRRVVRHNEKSNARLIRWGKSHDDVGRAAQHQQRDRHRQRGHEGDPAGLARGQARQALRCLTPASHLCTGSGRTELKAVEDVQYAMFKAINQVFGHAILGNNVSVADILVI